MDAICRHEQKLTRRLLAGLDGIDNVIIYGPPKIKYRIGVVSFTIDKIHPHEIAYLLDERAAILVRSGDHCSIPLMRYLGLENGTVRASLYLYNTLEEIDLLIETMRNRRYGVKMYSTVPCMKSDNGLMIPSSHDVVIEVPLAVFVNGRHTLTAMISPAMLEEFVTGFYTRKK